MKELIYVRGNLLTYPGVNICFQQCNCQNTFGSGIAAQIRVSYPEAYQADTTAHKNRKNVLGNVSWARVTSKTQSKDMQFIFNLYGQDFTSAKGARMTNYEGIFAALEKARNIVETLYAGKKMPTVGLPYLMSCALGGGRWEILEPMIQIAFDGYEGDVVVVEWDGKVAK